MMGLIIVLGLVAVVGIPARHATAQAAMEVVAQGLDNPRGITLGEDGALYVAEAGRGGAEPCVSGPEGGQVCYGASGAITRIANGRQERIVSGLPSIAGEEGAAAIGPVDVSVRPNGGLFALIGLGAPPAARAALGPEGPNFGQLIRVTSAGQPQNVVDIAAYEQTANPDQGALDSNPYSLVALRDRFIVADAGANALLEVGSNGVVSTLAVFPPRVVPAPPIPNLPPEIPMQAVPDSVVVGPDGAYYVSELTGFPFPVGGARVYRVVPGQQPQVFAEGFTNIIDLKFGSDGSLYVLEIATKGLLQAEQPGGDFSGALIRVYPDRRRTVVASQGLIAPGGLEIAPNGDVYVTNFGVLAGQGQVVRIRQAAPPAPLPNTGEADAPLLFPETGFSMDSEFLSFWKAHGGLQAFGYPLDSARQVDGQVVQWLERARFELHSANAAPYNVLLGRLGVDALERQGRSWQSFAKADPAAAHYFAETGHAIAFEPFWNFWSSHGLEFDGRAGTSSAESLALLGYPVSEPQMETNSSGHSVLTQWFERARLEYHPDNAPSSRVLIGRIGAELKPVAKQ
jgi:hypothetical protein